MKVQAAVMRTGNGPFTIEELELEAPRGDEVLVRMVATGMCHTDLLSRELPPEFFGGPQVYGHEGSGVVEAVGTGVTDLAEGDHVVLSFNHCGACPACDTGKLPYCYNLTEHNMSGGRPDGSKAFTDSGGDSIGSHFFGQSSFASHSVVARTSVVKVDPSYDLTLLGPLGCGIQTGAGAILNTLDVQLISASLANLQEYMRVLKPGGYAVVGDVKAYHAYDNYDRWKADYWNQVHGGDPYWREYASTDLAKLALQAGFTEASWQGLGERQYPFVLIARKD